MSTRRNIFSDLSCFGEHRKPFFQTTNQKAGGSSPFQRTKEEVPRKQGTSSFFVVSGSLWKGLEQPVRPLFVPAGADSPADCPQGRGRVPSSAPKKRFCGNAKPLLFLSFPEISGRDSNSLSGRLASPAHKKQQACAFRKPSSLLPFRYRPPLGTARGKKMPPARRNLEPAELGALLFSIDGCQRGKRFASRRGTVYAVSSPAARSPLWAALSAVAGRSWSTLVSNWAR